MKKLLLIAFIFFFGIAASNAQSTEKVTIKTSSVCNMCKQTLEKDMAYEKGVKSSSLDVATQMLTVTYNPKKTNPDKIRKAVSKVGYDADNVPAEPKAYEKLDDCCKKDQGIHE